MKIAIFHRTGFSERWIEYCQKNNIQYKLVDCFDTNIIRQLDDCDGLLWQLHNHDFQDSVAAKQLLLAFRKKGLKTFPDLDTAWHYDDKLAQKYLLEAIDAPVIPSYLFYSKSEAVQWISSTTFPKVFKLRGGAGSVNVKLVKNKQQALRLARRSFASGFKRFNRSAYLKDQYRNFINNPDLVNLKRLFVAFYRIIIPDMNERYSTREKGYVYFQDFVPGNDFDTRLVVIGNRCFGIRRYNRKNDFRASGSGRFYFAPDLLDLKCVRLAFDLNKKLNAQSVAYDFLHTPDGYKVVEISFSFPREVFYKCPGYWDDNLFWHNEPVIPQYFIIEDFIKDLETKNSEIQSDKIASEAKTYSIQLETRYSRKIV